MGQLQLALGDLPNPSPEEEAAAAEANKPTEGLSTNAPTSENVSPLRRKPRNFPTHLPRETIVHAPASCDCPECGSLMRKLGEDVS